MLDTESFQEPSVGQLHLLQRERLVNRHSQLLEKILKDNSHKSKYWILGRAVSKRKYGRTTIRAVMKAFDTQPDIQKESYLYEVDNVEGTRQLLWVMNPNNKLSLPTLGKSISVAGQSGELAAEVTGV